MPIFPARSYNAPAQHVVNLYLGRLYVNCEPCIYSHSARREGVWRGNCCAAAERFVPLHRAVRAQTGVYFQPLRWPLRRAGNCTCTVILSANMVSIPRSTQR